MNLSHEQCNLQFNGIKDIKVKRVLIALYTEFVFAKNQHPVWPTDQIHAAAIVTEEAGELIKASLQAVYEDKKWDNMHKEALQTGATVIRFVIECPKP